MAVTMLSEQPMLEKVPMPPSDPSPRLAAVAAPQNQARPHLTLQPAAQALAAIAVLLGAKLQIMLLILMAGALTYLTLLDPSAARLAASGGFDIFALLMSVFVLR